MPKYDVLISKEAGVYTQHFEIVANDEDSARKKAEIWAKKTEENWDYSEVSWNEPLIQSEEVYEIE